MLLLVRPSLPRHLRRDSGLLYARTTRAPDRVPAAFAAPLDAPAARRPWAALVAGLETGGAGMREHLEARWARPELREDCFRALSACYAGCYGHRADGPGRAGWLAWVQGLAVDRPELADLVAEHLDRQGRAWERAPLVVLGVDFETGHVPVDHDELLYAIADHLPALADAAFHQRALFGPDDLPDDDVVAYRLRTWCGGARFEVPARAFGDFTDAESVVGFVNSVLRALDSPDRCAVGEEAVALGRADHVETWAAQEADRE